MVKRGGGTKKKIKIEKITNKESLATAFTKRRYGLFSKISQLCLLTDAQIAVLATPLSSNSNVSFYSFGHTSVDSIVSAYLTGQRPVREETTREHEDIGICMARKELGLDLWFEDERLLKSNNPEQLTDAVNSMSRMLTNLKELSSDAVLQHPADQKTLIPQSNSPTTVLLDDDDDDLPANSNNEDQTLTEEQDQIKEICESFCVPEENNNNNNVLTGSLDQVFDIDQLIDFDFDTSILDDWCLESTNSAINNFEGFDDGSMVSDFSDYSNGTL